MNVQLKDLVAKKEIYIITFCFVIIFSIAAFANDNSKEQRTILTNESDAYFNITSIFIDIGTNLESTITINIASHNESEEIKPVIPNILPSKYNFYIKSMNIEHKNSDLFGANFIKDGNMKPDVLIPTEINISSYTFVCEYCVERLSDEPFDKYRFLFPFSVSRNGDISSGVIRDAIFVKIPEEYIFTPVGRTNVIGGGLIKVNGYVDSLPEDLHINDMPEDAFGFKINSKRVERMRFDSFNHVLLVEYGRSIIYYIFAIILPILALLIYLIPYKLGFKKDISFIAFILALIGIRWYFVGSIRLVIWDIELFFVGVIGAYLIFKNRKKD